MSIQLSWLLESRVILSKYSGEITLEELQSFIVTTHEYLDMGKAPLIHIVADATAIGKFPVNLGVLNKVLFKQRPHPKMGWIVVVTSNRSLSFISGMLAQIGKARFRAFKTMAEATTFLNDIDTTLPMLEVQSTAAQS